MMRLSDLTGKHVRTESGDSLGKAHEVRIKNGEVVAVVCGARGFMQRFFPTGRGRRIAWDRVRAVTHNEIVCGD